MSREAEHKFPVRLYDVYDTVLSSFYLLLGKKLSIDDPNVIPDNRAGRTEVGTTFEDFQLFWPPRPKTWFSYPCGNKDEFILNSRDELLLKEEQDTFVYTDNSLWIGQRKYKTPHGVLGNHLYNSLEDKMANVYKPSVDLRTNMQVNETYPSSNTNYQLQEFWDDHETDLEIATRLQRVKGLSLLSFATFTTFTTFQVAKHPKTRVLALPIGLLIGTLGTLAVGSFTLSLSNLEGLNQQLWTSRIEDGIVDYKNKSNIDIKPINESNIVARLQNLRPFSNIFTN